MFINHINPVLFTIGNVHIRYYGIFFALGILITFAFFAYIAKKKDLMNFFESMEIFTWGLLGLLIGARMFYAIVYNLSYYLSYPLKIFAINEGGLSFHGGLIGVVLGAWLYSLAYKKDFLQMADIIAIPACIGIAMVKIANFMNSELAGRVTNVSWAVNFNNETDAAGNLVYRHPSQLYEASKNIIIFSALWMLKDKNLKKGTIFSLFVIMYAALRFIAEFFRQPDSQIGFLLFGMTIGQWLSIAMLIAGCCVMFHAYNIRKN